MLNNYRNQFLINYQILTNVKNFAVEIDGFVYKVNSKEIGKNACEMLDNFDETIFGPYCNKFEDSHFDIIKEIELSFYGFKTIKSAMRNINKYRTYCDGLIQANNPNYTLGAIVEFCDESFPGILEDTNNLPIDLAVQHGIDYNFFVQSVMLG
jgi:hypothetical protein